MDHDQPSDEHPAAAGLTITKTTDPAGAVLITVAGSLDYDTIATLSTAVRDAYAADAPAVAIDLAAVGFCDSSGLAALVRAHKAALHAGRSLSIISPNPALNRMFALTGLDTVLPISTVPATTGPSTADGRPDSDQAGI
ncbi:STAS domain-containing protein [Dactylosporangium sp. NPDC051541]|uniref:STAS domain-containing protein n=1 Tax=Dactylosporangium sp. NPDC051541 TaxID=3363977 RepID=UPI0037B8D2DB